MKNSGGEIWLTCGLPSALTFSAPLEAHRSSQNSERKSFSQTLQSTVALYRVHCWKLHFETLSLLVLLIARRGVCVSWIECSQIFFGSLSLPVVARANFVPIFIAPVSCPLSNRSSLMYVYVLFPISHRTKSGKYFSSLFQCTMDILLEIHKMLEPVRRSQAATRAAFSQQT